MARKTDELTFVGSNDESDGPAQDAFEEQPRTSVALMQEDSYSESIVGDGAAQASFVYAIGQIEPRFPSLGLEKELAQTVGRAETAALTDRQAMHAVLSERANRHLLRQLCWVLTIEGLETYMLAPRDPLDFELLGECLRQRPRPTDMDVVIGLRLGNSPPELCNGLILPMVAFDQIYSFDADSLVEAIPKPSEADETSFRAAAEAVFWTIMQLADNAGATDEHRALNYLAIRYPAIYERASEAMQANASLTRVEVRPSRLSGIRRVVDVIFTFTDRRTDVLDQSFVRVDVTEEYPFLVTKLMPYFDR